jgi:hypothetical protein
MMKHLLRRLRGMLGLGATWAVIWTPIGAGIFAIQFLTRGQGFPPLELLVPVLLDGARNGFLGGFLFAAGLGFAYRSRTFADLRPRVIGAIGALAGMLLPAGTMLAAAMSGSIAPPALIVGLALGFGGALGAATAIGSLKLAQAAPTEVGSGDSSRDPTP